MEGRKTLRGWKNSTVSFNVQHKVKKSLGVVFLKRSKESFERENVEGNATSWRKGK